MLWIAWILAGVLAFAWLAVAVHATFADRSRGRRRCPGCFYDFADADHPACPECGRGITPASKLHKTRLHWGRVVLASLFLLLPAVVTAGAARIVQTGGWAALPDGLATRLVWIEHKDQVEDLAYRLQTGSMTRADASRVVNHAVAMIRSAQPSRITDGFKLVNAAASTTYSGGASLLLVELDVPNLAPTLRPFLDDPAHRRIASLALGMIRGTDPAILVDLLERTVVEQPDGTVEADQDVLRGLSKWAGAEGQHAPVEISNYLGSPFSLGDQYPLSVKAVAEAVRDTVAELRGMRNDRTAIIQWASQTAGTPYPLPESLELSSRFFSRRDGFNEAEWNHMLSTLSPDSRLHFASLHPEKVRAVIKRHLALQVWQTLDPTSTALQELTLRIARDGDSDDLGYVGTAFLAGLPWSDLVAETYRIVLADAETGLSATWTLAEHGLAAKALLPDLEALVLRPDRYAGSSGFPNDWIAIGGTPERLADLLVLRLNTLWPERIERVWTQRAGNPHALFRGDGKDDKVRVARTNLTTDLDWLAEIGIATPEVLSAIEPWMEYGEFQPATAAAVAYARLGGDKARATQVVLRGKPDYAKGQASYYGTAESRLLEMIRAEAADATLIEQTILRADDEDQVIGFLSAIESYWRGVKPFAVFRDEVARLAEDDRPAVARAARSLLDKLDAK